MKSLQQHIEEKLIINKDYKIIDKNVNLFINMLDSLTSNEIRCIDTHDSIGFKIRSDFMNLDNIWKHLKSFGTVLHPGSAYQNILRKEKMLVFTKADKYSYDTIRIILPLNFEQYKFFTLRFFVDEDNSLQIIGHRWFNSGILNHTITKACKIDDIDSVINLLRCVMKHNKNNCKEMTEEQLNEIINKMK